MRRFTIYSKPGCHLCERARAVLERCQHQEPFLIETVDISQQPDLAARFATEIPVILLDGREIARHFLRERQVLDSLSQSTEGEPR